MTEDTSQHSCLLLWYLLGGMGESDEEGRD